MEIRTKAALTAAIRAHGRTALVVNVRSRRGRRHFAQVRERLQAAGLDLVGIWPVSDPADLPDSLASAASCGADLVVVGGGDGTLSEASHQLAHRDVCLGVLPLGTTNNFARSLGLPLNLPEAPPPCAGRPRPVPATGPHTIPHHRQAVAGDRSAPRPRHRRRGPRTHTRGDQAGGQRAARHGQPYLHGHVRRTHREPTAAGHSSKDLAHRRR